MSSGSYLWTGERAYRPVTRRQIASRIAAVLFLIMFLFFAIGG